MLKTLDSAGIGSYDNMQTVNLIRTEQKIEQISLLMYACSIVNPIMPSFTTSEVLQLQLRPDSPMNKVIVRGMKSVLYHLDNCASTINGGSSYFCT